MSTDTKMQENTNTGAAGVAKSAKPLYLLDIVIIVAMGILMFCGASWQVFKSNTDVAKYQCYAAVFLQGTHVAKSYPQHQCDFISESQTYTNAKIAADLHKYGAPSFLVNFVKQQNITSPLRALPHEYPLLTLIPFLIALISPQHWYQVAFAILMALLAGGMYFLLARFKSRTAAIIGATLLVIGGWSTAVGRFDLVPSLLTLLAVILAEHKRWTWAFVLLALALLMKFYPVMLLIPFLVGQQMELQEKWNALRRWQPFAAFIGICVLVMGVSLLLSVEGTISPLSYFETRPIQAESLGSSLLWLSTFVTHHTLSFDNTYHSLNVQPVHILTSLVTYGEQLLELVGLAFVAWVQWQRKITLATATLLTLLVVIVTGKVFSPQYLIWVIPLVAYVVGTNWRWIVSWIAICALTTSIYPYTYYAPGHTSIIKVPLVPWFYPAVTLRNFLLLGFVLALLVYYVHQQVRPTTTMEQRNTGEIVVVSATEQSIPVSEANIDEENSSNVEKFSH
jgi:Glycosyltransferase family 87